MTTNNVSSSGRFVYQSEQNAPRGPRVIDINTGRWMSPSLVREMASVLPDHCQPAMPADADPAWMECETRRPYVVNSLRATAKDLRSSERRCRTAYRQDFMGKPSQYLADAYGEAAAVFESRLSALDARRRIEGES